MKIIKTKFKDLILIKNKVYLDKRGSFQEVINYTILKKNFIFDCISKSKRGVLRGLHFQTKKPQGKLVTVISGRIYDVAVDLRYKSKTYGQYFSTVLSANDGKSIYIPPNFAHGFYCLSERCEIYYKCTNSREKKFEKTLKWDDKDLNIIWPGKKRILSKKDKKGYSFKDINFKKN